MKDSERKIYIKLYQVISVKRLVEKTISASTQEKILTPMQQMDDKDRAKRAIALIKILKNSKSEEEIIKRASELEYGQ